MPVITYDFSKTLSGVDQATYDLIPSDAQAFYEKGADGKYAISAAVRPLVDTLMGVVAGIRDERGKVKSLNEENKNHRLALKPFEDLAEELGVKSVDGKALSEILSEHVRELAGAVKNGKEVKINLDKIQAQYKADQDKATKAAADQNTNMKKTLEKHLVDNAALAALAEHKGNNILLLPHIKNQTKVVEENGDYVVRVVDDQGNVRVTGTQGFMTVADLVKDMKTVPAFAGGFESEAAAGTGAKGGNPINKKIIDSKNKDGMSPTDKIGAGLVQSGLVK